MTRAPVQPARHRGPEGAAAEKPRREAPSADPRPGTGRAWWEPVEVRGVQGGRAQRAAPPWPTVAGRAGTEAPARCAYLLKASISSAAARRETVRVLSGRRVS